MTRQDLIIGGVIIALLVLATLFVSISEGPVLTPLQAAVEKVSNKQDYFRARYSPLHFRPASLTASNDQCLSCHLEILESRVLPQSPAGVSAEGSLAWYQQVSTYKGGQETFHRRHMVTAMAKELMNLQCNTCHLGNDPREEAPGSSADMLQDTTDITLRKQVNPETTCLKCHGQMPAKEIMGLTGTWPEVRDIFQNNCLTCHAAIRTNRHQVSYLNAAAIEAAAAENSGEVCYGCHGGRAWYRIAYPYPRNAWPAMPDLTPEWASLRPTHSEARFLPQPSTSGKSYQGH